MKRSISVIVTVILIVSLLCACSSPFAAKPFTNITSFRYVTYANGGTWIEYEIIANGESAEISHKVFDAFGDLEEKDEIATVSADYLSEFTALLNEHNISAWNGFSKEENVIDGHGFFITAATDSGQEFYAHGYENYPKHYDEVSSAIYTFFDQFEYTDKPEPPKWYESNERTIFTGSFSYDEAVEHYKDSDWGVRRDGFVNIGEVPVEDSAHAIELAKNENSMEYDTIDVAYDIHTRVYRVTFSTEGVEGGVVDVYISKEGVTLMMVLGE